MSAPLFPIDTEDRTVLPLLTSETDVALHHSTDCLRLAARLLDAHGIPEAAKYLNEQADKNMNSFFGRPGRLATMAQDRSPRNFASSTAPDDRAWRET